MNRRVHILAGMALLLASAGSRGEEYRDAQRHFRLNLPAGWTIADAAFVAETNRIVRERMPALPILYTAGFQVRGNQPGQYPYILVQWQAGALPGSYEEIEKDFNKGQVSKAAKDAKDALADMVSNLSLDQFVLDRNRNRGYMRSQSDVAGIGKVEGLSVSFLGKDGMVILHCYDQAGEFARQRPTFNQIVDSFQYDAGYAYQPGGSIMGAITRGALIGGVVGLVVAVVTVLVKMKKKQTAETIQ